MVFKIVTDLVRSSLSSNPPIGVTISDVNGVFVITSRHYSTLYFTPSEVVSIMAMYCDMYCGRIITATFINDGISNYGN